MTADAAARRQPLGDVATIALACVHRCPLLPCALLPPPASSSSSSPTPGAAGGASLTITELSARLLPATELGAAPSDYADAALSAAVLSAASAAAAAGRRRSDKHADKASKGGAGPQLNLRWPEPSVKSRRTSDLYWRAIIDRFG